MRTGKKNKERKKTMVKEEKEILYEPPILEISHFSSHDVIATSGEGESGENGDNVNSGGWT